jgi:hypothetical protein
MKRVGPIEWILACASRAACFIKWIAVIGSDVPIVNFVNSITTYEIYLEMNNFTIILFLYFKQTYHLYFLLTRNPNLGPSRHLGKTNCWATSPPNPQNPTLPHTSMISMFLNL